LFFFLSFFFFLLTLCSSLILIPSFGLAYLAHTLLFAHNLYINGNDEQRQRFLPRASSGELIGGMCMSEPGAGTDVLGMTTQARKEGNSYALLLSHFASSWLLFSIILFDKDAICDNCFLTFFFFRSFFQFLSD
jgi:hypothetical protein